MRTKMIFAASVPFILLITTATLAKDAQQCTEEKLQALRTVTAQNVGTKLRQHFSVPALARAVIGGAAKWKANPDQHQDILARFSDPIRLASLYDSLAKFKDAKVLKYEKSSHPHIALTRIRASGQNYTVTIAYAKGSCTIIRMCTTGKGCAYELFR